jgi:pimeloyl-ACP methyl ester carboxylesterase
MAQDILEYCNGHNLTNIDMIGHSMGKKLRCFFATLYPEMVDKLIIADIAPKFYPQHHQSILGGLNVDFQRNQADLKWKKSLLLTYRNQTVFNEKLVLGRARQLAFRFNVAVF